MNVYGIHCEQKHLLLSDTFNRVNTEHKQLNSQDELVFFGKLANY